MRTLFINLLTLIGLISCNTKNPVPTDTQMVEHFNQNKEDMELLVSYFFEDSLKYFPLLIQDINNGDTLTISRKREQEYLNLMTKTSIISISKSFDLPYVESVILYHFGKGGIGWSVDKGYEYVITPDVEFVYGKNELWDEAQKHNYANLRKKLDDKWNLYLNYDK